MQPTSSALKAPLLRRLPNAVIPGIVVAGAVYGLASYIRSQLIMESNIMNSRFAQQNSPRVMEARKKHYLIETEGDPRKTLYNVLNWS
ncbi:hypothetical protein OQA88_6115 [Cercophora sp. LCS_1]